MKRPPNYIWAGLGLIVIALGIGPVTPTWADKVKRPQRPEKSQAKSLEGPKVSQPTRTASTSCAGVEVSLATGGTKCIKPGSGKSFKDCAKCPEMVVVPAGRFMMGSSKEEIASRAKKHGYYFKDEGPRHEVVIPKAFAVGKYAVTFNEWDACVADGSCGGYKLSDWGWGRGDRPVINVNWDQAQLYVKWLSRKTGKSYRLLSEAEWEYAARAGTVTPFWWGSSITPDQANYDGNYVYKGGGKKGEYRKKTVPVKTFQPNPWGLYQVHGNVWEWCEDPWHHNYSGAPTDGSAWLKGGTKIHRVLRGGSWDDIPGVLRSADRFRYFPIVLNGDIGFRVSRTLNP